MKHKGAPETLSISTLTFYVLRSLSFRNPTSAIQNPYVQVPYEFHLRVVAARIFRTGREAGYVRGDVFPANVASAAGTELGLDVVEIEQDAHRGTTVTAGKYLSHRFFATVSWPISISSDESSKTTTGAKEVSIEYELFNWLLLRMISDGSTVEFNLLYEYAY